MARLADRMDLHPEEPEAGPWNAVDDAGLRQLLERRLPARPALVLVDGRSGSGKTTFAERLARLLGGTVAHTDDLSWNHDPVAWDGLAHANVIAPWRRGGAVDYRPPAWVRHGREGAIAVPAGAPVLVLEGVGAGRRSLDGAADLRVWVQSDRRAARERGLARDVELGRSRDEAVRFWDAWMASEEPFLAEERPWDRADLVVRGVGGRHEVGRAPRVQQACAGR